MEDSISNIAGKLVKNKLKMKFPTSYHKLNKIFLNARDPEITELQGEYIVDILSWLPSLKRLNHRKIINVMENTGRGHNVVMGKTWGRFSVTENTEKESVFHKALKLSYDNQDNSFLIRNIRDYIRCIEDNTLYIGKFFYRIFKRSVFIGYFSLKKIK